ncbi:MAG: sensor histidine kinase [Cyanobacteria bacterium J06649_4]
MDIGQIIALRKDDIVQAWISKVKENAVIQSDRNLTYKGILDSLPSLIDAIAHLLTKAETNDQQNIEDMLRSGLDHGALRAKQGYDAEEIVREYGILRDTIFNIIEPDLLERKPLILLRTVRLIDGSIDQVIAICLKRYTEERLQEVNLLYDEMVASNEELDRLVRNEQKNLAHLAHELKTPLSCIIGYSDLFLRQQAKASEIKVNFIERVLASGRQLLSIINETLEVSACRAGKVSVQVEPINACEVIEEVANVMDTLAKQKGLRVIVDCEQIRGTIMSDRSRLRQILTNLISNAVRYTEQGEVRISGRTSSHESEIITIAIADTGLGIVAEEQDRIFEPYYQGKAGQQLPSSTGLGLAIANQMVKLLQGSIKLISEPDIGSTFTITLPVQYPSESSSLEPATSLSSQ